MSVTACAKPPPAPEYKGPTGLGADSAAPEPPPPAGGARLAPLPVIPKSSFYHLAEGSEIFPLAFLRGVPGKHGKPGDTIMSEENLAWYGLLRDDKSPDNPQGLPIGMTLGATANTRLAGFEVIGFNCAACHVGQLQAENQTVPIEGAPNMFDIKLFNSDVADAFKQVLKHPVKALAFFVRLHPASRDDGPPLRSSLIDDLDPETLELYRQLPSYERLQKGNALEKQLAKQLRTLLEKELASAESSTVEELVGAQLGEGSARGDVVAPTEPRGAGSLQTIKPGAGEEAYAPYLSPELDRLLNENVELSFLPPGARGGQKRSIKQLLADFALTVRWLAQRAALLYRTRDTAKFSENSRTGPGRVDAFGTARNLLFPKFAAETDAPICYPHLWGFEQVRWLHWDGNTTSILERNIGQALGLGAIADASSGASSVRIRNIHELERYAGTIKPPTWPFTPPKPEDVAAGKVLFDKHCNHCHETGIGTRDELAANEGGTDGNRVRSFNRQVGERKFPAALHSVLELVKTTAFATEHVSPAEQAEWDKKPSEWRDTTGYAKRSLEGIWASPPYLHNGSVPTLDALLLPPGKRPKTFWVGSREFNVKEVGYDTKRGTWKLHTVEQNGEYKGNSNLGHEYPPKGEQPLEPEERRVLVEYMKLL